MIIKRIMNVIEEQGVISESQHAFRRGRGRYTANLQLKKALETAWQRRTKLYGSSWDFKKAFDSVSKAVIRLARTRLGVPAEQIEWMVEFDMDARVAVRTLCMVNVWETQGLAGFNYGAAGESPSTFNLKRGMGQGDINSPHTWVAVFNILLRASGRSCPRSLLAEEHGRRDVPSS